MALYKICQKHQIIEYLMKTKIWHGMSVKCEQPIDELSFQVWLLYDHPNFKYCTSFISGTELRTNGQTDGRTDKRTDDPNTIQILVRKIYR